MNLLQRIGVGLFLVALVIFTLALGLSEYQLTESSLNVKTSYHEEAILNSAKELGVAGKTFSSNYAYISALKAVIKHAQKSLADRAKAEGLPEGTSEWDYKIGNWEIKGYVFETVKASAIGFLPNNIGLMFFLTFGLGIIGGLLYILPIFKLIPGIKNHHLYHSALTRGLDLNLRTVLVIATIIGILWYGISYMGAKSFYPLLTTGVIATIIGLVYFRDKQINLKKPRSASPEMTGWVGVIAGIYLIGFYVLLYWTPEFLTNWILLVDPISRWLSGHPASQWFLYGFLYTLIVLVMGIRMLAKYQHNRYQVLRTFSVMFFQTAFAFLIPEILVRLNQPWYDFKNIWPLNYTFFFDWNISQLISSGGLGVFMLVWGIALVLIGVPVITYFFGKRWYCSWVCGCGGLAETMGDPYRQLSDKSLRAWQYERYIIHGVLVFAVIMTVGVLYTYFTGSRQVLFFNSDVLRTWYGFLIGSAFAGVVGTGFYPLMGNRMWCRFGCPLAAYLGLVQKFKSKFRITVNGSQCMSCGNCSTYCEMGIDVRWYAQRGQDVVRSSCVGCGICSAVCPRGVLRLENATSDVSTRTQTLRTLHIDESGVKLMA